jgi:HD-GYP domain-containing protein (c-di-GMP phosphodiesterase class II)
MSIADISASALLRCLLSEEMQQQLQRLTSVHTINMAINASLDVRVTLQLLVNQITSQLGVDATDVLLIDPVTRDLKFAAGHGFRSREVEKSRYWLGEGKPGQVALRRQAMTLYDPAGIAGEFPQSPWMSSEGFVAYEAVPLTNKGEVKGVLETFHRAPCLPDPEWPRFLESLAMQISIAINNAELLDRLQHNNLELGLAYDATIEGWARALEMRDEETEGHTQRVTEWTVRLAQGMGISGEDVIQMRRGALMHDIGKMGIPDQILRKKGPLDEAEWAIMREHPRMAFEMMASINFLRPALAIPFSHHERWNGSGYPQKLSGRQIPLSARIFAVVDVWDALYRGRLYRPPMPESEVLDYLRGEAGRLFDPEVVHAFVEMRSVIDKRG